MARPGTPVLRSAALLLLVCCEDCFPFSFCCQLQAATGTFCQRGLSHPPSGTRCWSVDKTFPAVTAAAAIHAAAAVSRQLCGFTNCLSTCRHLRGSPSVLLVADSHGGCLTLGPSWLASRKFLWCQGVLKMVFAALRHGAGGLGEKAAAVTSSPALPWWAQAMPLPSCSFSPAQQPGCSGRPDCDHLQGEEKQKKK